MIYYLIFILLGVTIALKIAIKIKNPPIDKDLALVIYFIVAMLIYLIPFELLKMMKFKDLEAYTIIISTLYLLSVIKKQK